MNASGLRISVSIAPDSLFGLVPVSTGRRKMEKLSVDCDHVKTQTLKLNANNNKLVAQAA